VYPRSVLEDLVRIAERAGLVLYSDEIYDQMLYDDAEFVPLATLAHDTLCATLSGLSKIYRACGYRVGWASFSGRVARRPTTLSPRAPEFPAPVRRSAGAVGGADGARRLSEHSRTGAAGRTIV